MKKKKIIFSILLSLNLLGCLALLFSVNSLSNYTPQDDATIDFEPPKVEYNVTKCDVVKRFVTSKRIISNESIVEEMDLHKNVEMRKKPRDIVKEGDVIAERDGQVIYSKTNGMIDRITVNDHSVICSIVNYDSFKIVVLIDSATLALIKYDCAVSIVYNNKSYEGTIDYIGYQIDENGEVEVQISFIDQNCEIMLGSSVDVFIDLATRKDVLAVNSDAVYASEEDENSYYVLVVEDENVIEKTVEIGLVGNEYTEIIEGLEEGDRVVAIL